MPPITVADPLDRPTSRHRYTGTQVRRYAGIQVHKYAGEFEDEPTGRIGGRAAGGGHAVRPRTPRAEQEPADPRAKIIAVTRSGPSSRRDGPRPSSTALARRRAARTAMAAGQRRRRMSAIAAGGGEEDARRRREPVRPGRQHPTLFSQTTRTAQPPARQPCHVTRRAGRQSSSNYPSRRSDLTAISRGGRSIRSRCRSSRGRWRPTAVSCSRFSCVRIQVA
jgi:hypothetical protein